MSILNKSNVYEEVSRITYYAMVRGMKVLSVDDPSMYGSTPELLRAALVTMFCVRDRVVYDEALLYTYYLERDLRELSEQMEGKKAEEFGLYPKYRVEGKDSYIRLVELPNIIYVSDMGIEYESERDAFEKFMMGSIGLTEYGSFIRYFPKQSTGVSLGDELVPDYGALETGELENVIVSKNEGVREETVILLTPNEEELQQEVGTIASCSMDIEVHRGDGEDGFLIRDAPKKSYVLVAYRRYCRIKVKYTIRYATRKLKRSRGLPMIYINQASSLLGRIDQEMKTIVRIAYRKLMDMRLNIGGCSRHFLWMLQYLRTLKSPHIMPGRELMEQIISIAFGVPIKWVEYAPMVQDASVEIISFYMCKVSPLVDLNCLNVLRPPVMVDWTHLGAISAAELESRRLWDDHMGSVFFHDDIDYGSRDIEPGGLEYEARDTEDDYIVLPTPEHESWIASFSDMSINDERDDGAFFYGDDVVIVRERGQEEGENG